MGSGELRSKTPMLSSPRKPPSNRLLPVRSLRLTHHVKLMQQLLEDALEPVEVALAATALLQPIREDRRPRVDRRVHVAEVPLVGGDLAARVEVLVAQHQLELVLAEVLVDHRQREHVEREVPGREPRVLPLVGHRDDVGVVACGATARCATRPRLCDENGADAALLEPAVDVVVVVLLRPQHPGQRLADDVRRRPHRARSG